MLISLSDQCDLYVLIFLYVSLKALVHGAVNYEVNTINMYELFDVFIIYNIR